MSIVADAVVEQLYVWGVRFVWGVTGDAILHLVDALARHGDIRYIDVHHEEAAALAASAFAKATGQLGVCIATSGPGTAHLINGLADASSDRAPVLAITGQVARNAIGTNQKQYIDQQLLLSAVCTFTAPIADAPAVLPVLLRAMRAALTNAAPAHVDIPLDVWPLETTSTVSMLEPYLDTPATSSPEVIDVASAILAQAKRPLIYIGRGAARAIDLVMELAELWKAPVVRTLGATGFTPGCHPLVAGGIGEGGSDAASSLIAAADCILRLGATWWPKRWVTGNWQVVAVDIIPANVSAATPPTYGVVGDCRQVLTMMLAKMQPVERPKWQAQIVDSITAWNTRIDTEIHTNVPGALSPAQLMRTLQMAAPSNAVIALDVGEHTLWFNRIFQGNGQQILLSGTWRTMGYGISAAFAAKLAYPEKPVVAIVGDGGLSMMLAELTTLVKHQLPVIIVVVNNGCLALEKHTMEYAGLDYRSTLLHNPDFAAVARASGAAGYRVDSIATFEHVLKESLAMHTPSVIDVVTADICLPSVPVRAKGPDYRPKP